MSGNKLAKYNSLLPVFGWTSGALFFFYAWIQRVAPSVMVEELMREFAANATVLGSLSAVYFYGYAGMQIPVGLLLDRFGTRRLMILSALTCVIGSLIFALGTTLAVVMAGRFLVGASAAFALVGTMSVAAHWFAPSKFALLSGLAMATGMAGGIFGQAPIRLGVELTHWRTTLLMLVGFGLLVTILIFFTIRDRPNRATTQLTVAKSLSQVCRQPQTWLIAMAGLGSTAPLLGFAGLWGIPFIEASRDITRVQAASLASLLIVGWGIGAPLWGWISDVVRRRRTPLLIGFTLQTLSIAALITVSSLVSWQVGLLCFMVGLFGSSQITCFALIREQQPMAVVSTGLGIINALVTGAGALFQPLIGWLLDYRWQGKVTDGLRLYEVDTYRFALTPLIMSCFAALICAFFIRETYGEQNEG